MAGFFKSLFGGSEDLTECPSCHQQNHGFSVYKTFYDGIGCFNDNYAKPKGCISQAMMNEWERQGRGEGGASPPRKLGTIR